MSGQVTPCKSCGVGTDRRSRLCRTCEGARAAKATQPRPDPKDALNGQLEALAGVDGEDA